MKCFILNEGLLLGKYFLTKNSRTNISIIRNTNENIYKMQEKYKGTKNLIPENKYISFCSPVLKYLYKKYIINSAKII